MVKNVKLPVQSSSGAQQALAAAVMLAVLIVFNSGECLAMDYTLKIELESCQPNGIINVWKAMFDPKEFWIEQVVVLEMGVERYHLGDSLADCDKEHSKADMLKCKLYFQNKFDALLKCLKSSRILCRAHGGC